MEWDVVSMWSAFQSRTASRVELTFAKESGAASEEDALVLVEHLHGRLVWVRDQCKQSLNN